MAYEFNQNFFSNFYSLFLFYASPILATSDYPFVPTYFSDESDQRSVGFEPRTFGLGGEGYTTVLQRRT